MLLLLNLWPGFTTPRIQVKIHIFKRSNMQGLYGLLGKKLKHSFSKLYFEAKFESQKVDAQYDLFELEDISGFPQLLAEHSDLKGLNVTIPYKQQVMQY